MNEKAQWTVRQGGEGTATPGRNRSSGTMGKGLMTILSSLDRFVIILCWIIKCQGERKNVQEKDPGKNKTSNFSLSQRKFYAMSKFSLKNQHFF